jgi:hypothetical protein
MCFIYLVLIVLLILIKVMLLLRAVNSLKFVDSHFRGLEKNCIFVDICKFVDYLLLSLHMYMVTNIH